MRESIKIAPLYIAMIGVPILMFLFLLSYVFFPYANTILMPLIIAGLLVFGVSGAREVYLQKQKETGIKLNGNLYGKTVTHGGVIKENGAKHVTVKIKRFNIVTRKIEPNIFKIGADKFTTVLDALILIKEKKDKTLSMRYSCRMGICGSCGMVVNGKPVLACETNVLKNAKNDEIEVAPMQGNPILKDLVDDFDDFFEKHQSINPYLYRKNKNEQYAAKEEFRQTQEEIERFLPYSYCIMCGLCMDACPIVNTNPSFIGPQALSQVYRYKSDTRDQKENRIENVDVLEGIWSCEFAGACSKVCPKGVDPATAIQLLKSDAMKNIIKKDE